MLFFILSGLSYFQTLCGEATVSRLPKLTPPEQPRFLIDILQRRRDNPQFPRTWMELTRGHTLKEGTLM